MKTPTSKYIYTLFKHYGFAILLMSSIFIGGLAGIILGPKAHQLKPLGDIFLNLIFIAIIPLIFFSITHAIAKSGSLQKISKIIFFMVIIFILTSTIASVTTIFIVKLFPPAKDIHLIFADDQRILTPHVAEKIIEMFTINNFSKLLSRENILPLIVFSILIGFVVLLTKNKTIIKFLQFGEKLFLRVFSLIMYYAPIGFFAYFADLVSTLGPQLMSSYLRVAIIYYSFASLYFIFIYTLYAFLAGKMTGVKLFWQNIFLPSITALATCSSAATIPANLVATQKMRISPEIYETVIPLGTIIHKDGSVMGGIIKIAFLFGIFHLSFSGSLVLFTAIGISLLVGTVMGAIPSGGMLGEMLILSVYGFPSSTLIAIAAISIIIDPLATVLNATGNTIASMMLARIVNGKRWFLDNRNS